MYDSNEFSPFNFAPLGIPGNPLDGTPGLEIIPNKKPQKGTRAPLALPGRLSFQEMADVGTPPRGVPIAQEPSQLLVPDVVSATDPAFSATPQVRNYIEALGKVPAADTGSTSPWTQWMTRGRGMTTSGLKKALQSRGMDQGNYQTQGALPGGTN